MLNDTNIQALSRRSFLVTTGAFSVAVAFGSVPTQRNGVRCRRHSIQTHG